MRMGKAEKKRRGDVTPRADAKGIPKNAARGSYVGELSPDLISTYFAPELMARAAEGLEEYAAAMLEYSDLVKELESNGTVSDTSEAEISPDGSVKTSSDAQDIPDPPAAPLFRSQAIVDELSEMLEDTSKYFQAKKGAGWKIQANAMKLERQLDEKYGRLRPFLTNHPEVEQFVRNAQRKYAQGHFSPLRQTKPPIPRSTAVIILFMMKRGNVSWQVLTLSALFFLVGLQPWALVAVVALFHQLLERRKRKPLSPMKSYIPAVEPYYATENESEADQKKKQKLLERVGRPFDSNESADDYDTIVLGTGGDVLYTAALLSRTGRKVLVLSPRTDASGCVSIQSKDPKVMQKFQNVPFDVENYNISKISRQQVFLAPALATSTDYQGGVRFSQVGSDADGHAFEILSVPGMGTEHGAAEPIPFVLRADGVPSLMDDAAQSLADGWPGINGEIGNSSCGGYVQACEAINASSNNFYLSKILPDNVNNLRSKGTFHETAVRFASAFLDKAFPTNAHARSLMAAIGMKGENIKPSRTSMAATVTNICSAMSGEGMHYPIGGPRALCHAFAAVIEQSGGRIVTEANIESLLFEPVDESKPKVPKKPVKEGAPQEPGVNCPRCIGVRLSDKREIKFDMTKLQKGSKVEPAVLSMQGFISTFIRFLPETIRMEYKVPQGLPAMAERRPVFKIVYALTGSASDLSLTGADFYRLPGAALAQDEIDPTTGQIRHGEIGWVDDEEETETPEGALEDQVNQEPAATGGDNPQGSEGARGKRDKKKPKRNKFDTGVSYMQISFPSAKDPSFEQTHGKISTCVVTIEADDDFVTHFDTKPKLFAVKMNMKANSGELVRLLDRVRKDLVYNYPQLQGKIVHEQLFGPFHRNLSHSPERYAAKGIRAESPYPGLYSGGNDLTVGDSLSGGIVGGWLAANAVMGYAPLDHLFLGKNITSDISQYLEEPTVPEDEPDLAVPYTPPAPAAVEKKQDDETEE